MGLQGSGKTTLAERISKKLKADWLNADRVRTKFKDYDFSHKGIIRQVSRMKKLSSKSKKKFVVADFVCPKKQQIKIFKPDFVIWMDTIKKGRFADMNKMFRPPEKYNIRLKRKNIKVNLKASVSKIKSFLKKNEISIKRI